MKEIKIRELMHNFSSYLKEVKNGERITILDRNNPVADLVPHNENIQFPGWQRKIKRVKAKKESVVETLLKSRSEER